MRTSIRLAFAACLLVHMVGLGAQEPRLTVTHASPRGVLSHLTDAAEVRLTFSEPMIAIGAPDAAVPAWLRVEPSTPVSVYWSGTRTLIVSPSGETPLPYGTPMRIHVDRTAQSIAGRRLAAPFVLEFTTPRARVLGVDWYRVEGQVNQPIVIRLRFNQPMDPARTLAALTAAHQPHTIPVPVLTPDERRRWRAEDPENLARFDARMAHIRSVASSTRPIAVRLASAWNEERFPRDSSSVVFETNAAPEPGARIRLALSGTLTGATGTEPHPAQWTDISLEAPLMVTMAGCPATTCPQLFGGWPIRVGSPVLHATLSRHLSVEDVSDAGKAVPLAQRPPPAPWDFPTEAWSTNSLGFPEPRARSTWRIRIDRGLRSVDGQTLGYDHVALATAPHDPAYVAWDGAVWEASGGTTVPFVSANVTRVWQGVAPMRVEDAWLRLTQLASHPRTIPLPPQGAERTIGFSPDTHETHGVDLTPALSGRTTGLAWAHVRSLSTLDGAYTRYIEATRDRPALLQVTNLGLSVKDSPHSTLLVVTTLDRVQPVAGAAVTIRGRNDAIVWSGITDADGMALAPALPLRAPNNPGALSWVATAEKDGDVTWVPSTWSDPWAHSFGLRYDLHEAGPVLRGMAFSDRGVYQQGEAVQVKALLRMDTPGGHQALSEGSDVEGVVRGPRGAEVARARLRVNRWSSVEWRFPIPRGSQLGQYSVTMSMPVPEGQQSWGRPSVSTRFLVAAFKRPDFRVDVTATSVMPLAGEPLNSTITARYLFGASVGAQPVRWTLRRGYVRDIPAAITDRFPERAYVFGYVPTDARPEPDLRHVRTQLTPDGTLSLSETVERGTTDSAASYTFEAEVQGPSGQFIANRATMVQHPASMYVGLARPAFLVDARQALTTAAIVAGLDGHPRAGVPVTVALLRDDWHMIPNGAWQRTETSVREWTLTSTNEAVPLTVALPSGGRFVLRATARDEQGRSTRTDAAFYAFGGGSARWKIDGAKIDLIPERTTWRPGESARILVASPWPDATAIVTTEREGIRSHRRVAITSTQDTISVPITSADIPNVYVSVLLLKGRTDEPANATDADPGRPAYRLGYTELQVDAAEKRLAVDVTADRAEYRPGDNVRVAVDVSAADGRRRETEVTLWAVDYGLLSLTGYAVADVARSVYANKALQVMTQDTRARLIARRPLTVNPAARGGGGGGGGGGRGGASVAAAASMVPPPSAPRGHMETSQAMSESLAETVEVSRSAEADDVRSDFRPLAFWVGSLDTDAQGRATTTVSLPDSLTTYRIMAVAGDPASHFGAGLTEIRATKPLTLLPAFPRFLIVGNRASLGAVITNGTATADTAEVLIERAGGDGLTFEGPTSHRVRIDAGASVPVRFDVRAVDNGTARLRLRVRLGADTDAFEMPLPIHAPARPVTVAGYGETTSSARERVRLPGGLVADRGGLTVSVASTALVGLNESVRFLDDFEYECAEPLASKALALLLSADLGGAFSPRTTDVAAIRAAGLDTLRELSAYQCSDGGFGMFKSNCRSMPYLTAYVLDVMRAAGALGATVDPTVTMRALEYLGQQRTREPQVEARPVWAATQAFIVKVLAEGGNHDRNADAISTLYANVEWIPNFALSYLADALAASGDRGPRYQNVIRRLLNAIRVDADRAFVEEQDDAALRWLWHTNTRATAVVLEGVTRRKDATGLAPALARWLLSVREGGRWQTTHDNGVALMAVAGYYRAFETAPPSMRVTVDIGGRVVGNANFRERTDTSTQVHVPLADLGGERGVDVNVTQSGTGRTYFTTRLDYVPEGLPAETARGMHVTRGYQRVGDDGTFEDATSFATGDVVRVTVRLRLLHEGRFLAITDPVPAGLEPIDGAFSTTAADLARVATTQSSDGDWRAWWRRGGFDHVEKHDDRVVAYATRLSQGVHEVTYLARAMTAGTFETAGPLAQAIYTPEISGRGPATTVVVLTDQSRIR